MDGVGMTERIIWHLIGLTVLFFVFVSIGVIYYG